MEREREREREHLPAAYIVVAGLTRWCVWFGCLLQNTMRKLLSRIDHQEYTAQLERMLVEKGKYPHTQRNPAR